MRAGNRSWPMAVFIAAASMAGACGAERVCAPGSTQACVCTGNGSGAQTCAADGARWGGCECAVSAAIEPPSAAAATAVGGPKPAELHATTPSVTQAPGVDAPKPAVAAGRPPTAPQGRGTALGSDPMNALGAVMGDEVGKNFGFGGLGLKGTGAVAPNVPQQIGPTKPATTGLASSAAPVAPAAVEGTGSDYGRAAGGFHGRSEKIAGHVTSEVSSAPPRSREEIKKTLLSEHDAVRRCYEQQLQHHPGLQGGVIVHLSIDAAGLPQKVNVTENTTGDPVLGGCVARAVKTMKFGPGAPTGVQYPVQFETGRTAGGSQDWMAQFAQGIELGLKLAPLLL